MAKSKIYPLSESFRGALRTTDAFRIALALNRTLKAKFEINDSEVDILILLASRKEPLSITSVVEEVDYISTDRVSRLLKRLIEVKLVSQVVVDAFGAIGYTASDRAVLLILKEQNA